MASGYPTALDTFATNKTGSSSMSGHASSHNDLADAVNKIEAELGINPSGSYATVAAALAAGITATDQGVRYVVSSGGSDSNNGFSQWLPMATIQAAINSLSAAFDARALPVGLSPAAIRPIGTVFLGPGLHNVGTGVVVPHRRPVAIVGTMPNAILPGSYQSTGTTPTIYSSGTPTQLITFGDNSNQHFGGHLENIAFRLTSSQTCAVRLNSVNHFRAHNVAFYTASLTSQDSYGVLLDCNSGGDGSWGHILGCSATSMGLFKTNTTGQVNYWRFLDNHISMGTAATAGISLVSTSGISSCTISDTHIEAGPAVAGPALYMRASYKNMISNLHGECTDLAWPFIDLGGTENTVLGGACTAEASGTTGVFIQLTSGAESNFIAVPHLRHANDATATFKKDRYVDLNANSTNVFVGGEGINLSEAFLMMQARSAVGNPAASHKIIFHDASDTVIKSQSSAGTLKALEN